MIRLNMEFKEYKHRLLSHNPLLPTQSAHVQLCGKCQISSCNVRSNALESNYRTKPVTNGLDKRCRSWLGQRFYNKRLLSWLGLDHVSNIKGISDFPCFFLIQSRSL